MGRPSEFTQEKADTICERLEDGESLRSICADDGMPSTVTVSKWLRENTTFLSQYAQARERQADTFVDAIVDIADKAEDANLARIQIDARKWAAGKLRPKVYGEKVDHTHGGDPANPIKSLVEITIVDPKA